MPNLLFRIIFFSNCFYEKKKFGYAAFIYRYKATHRLTALLTQINAYEHGLCVRASERAPGAVRLRAVACGCVRAFSSNRCRSKRHSISPLFAPRAASRAPHIHSYGIFTPHAARRTPHARNREPCARISGIRYLVASSSLSLSKSAVRAALQHNSIRGATSASLFPCFLPFSLARSIARSLARSLLPFHILQGTISKKEDKKKRKPQVATGGKRESNRLQDAKFPCSYF